MTALKTAAVESQLYQRLPTHHLPEETEEECIEKYIQWVLKK